eukprot:s2695_g3.t1
MPRELGQSLCCITGRASGRGRRVVSTLTSPAIVSFKTLGADWTVEALLDAVAEAACRGECQALIDTGALVTGLTNKEVAEHLLGLKKRTDGSMPITLPDWIEGVVFIEEDGAKRILSKPWVFEATNPRRLWYQRGDGMVYFQTVVVAVAVVIIGAAPDIEVGKLAVRPSTGALDSANFAANHRLRGLGGLWFRIWDLRWIKPEARTWFGVARLQAGMPRDFAQGAYRMRGIGRGQSICLYIIPEIEQLISRDIGLAHLPQLPGFASLGSRHKGVLDAVACWLLCQSMRTEKVQYAMLQLQNLANIWRRTAACIELKIADAQRFVQDADRPELEEIRGNMRRLAEAGGETEETQGERGLETEQQREQEQERQQEVEEEGQREQEIQIEKFVDLMHCRDHEEPVPWDVDTLAVPAETPIPKQFYEARDFRLWKRQPLKSLPQECLLSRNWFDPQWSGFRRVKNVFMQLEWVSDKSRLRRAKHELPLNRVEERCECPDRLM